jgi:hypothetical protein
MLKNLAAITGLLLVSVFSTPDTPSDAPAYGPHGSLIAPTHYREWIYLTSGIDMSYTASQAPAGHSMFDNVFVNPASYKRFLETGTWPDGTTFVLEIRGAENPISINKRGHTQSTEIMGEELHVKDHGTWSFYDLLGGASEATLLPVSAPCYSCHQAHGLVDTTFVQFYPTLLPIAKQNGTMNPRVVQEIEAGMKPDAK